MAFRGPLPGLCPLTGLCARDQPTHELTATARSPLQRLCAFCAGPDDRRDEEAAQARATALQRKKLLRLKIYQQLLLGKDDLDGGEGSENMLRQELSSELAALRSNGSPDAIKEGKRARAPITATSRPAGRQFMWGQRPAVAPVRITVRSMWTD